MASLSRDAETLLSKDIKHECEECYSGDIKAKRVLGVSLKFLKLDKLGLSADLLESSSKICNIYYCKDHDEFDYPTVLM